MILRYSSFSSFFSLSNISSQAHMRSSTSHLPSSAPPHGPLRRPLAHWVRGHVPPYIQTVQSPHILHCSFFISSLQKPPRDSVSRAGYNGIPDNPDSTDTPPPQDITRTASAFLIPGF